ncbi:hypothetical protein ES708_01940 [subsurface metagenome]
MLVNLKRIGQKMPVSDVTLIGIPVFPANVFSPNGLKWG